MLRLLGCSSLMLLSSLSFCYTPWFTGPLLAPSGDVIPKGHANFEFYTFYNESRDVFTRDWRRIQTSANESSTYQGLLSYGLADNLDLEWSAPFSRIHNNGTFVFSPGDIGVNIGIQALKQPSDNRYPDLRIMIQQVFPAGRYDNLNPLNNGNDGNGLGVYQLGLSLNFQYLKPIFNEQFLRTRFILSHVEAASTRISGLSIYGGAFNTNGRINPGSLSTVDLAFEYSINQNWVGVIEGFISYRNGTRFKGFAGTELDGSMAQIGHDAMEEITLAPAIEYNFSSRVGIIGGVWWTLAGKNTRAFTSSVLALNVYF